MHGIDVTVNKEQKIFCIGLSRTGTTALAHALNELGIKTLHYSLPVFVQLDQISPGLKFEPNLKLNRYWSWRRNKEIKSQRIRTIHSILNEYQGFADLPFPFLFKELYQCYPNAKFIYTYRDENKWLASMKWLIEDGPSLWNQGILDEEIRVWSYKTEKYDAEKLLLAYRTHKNDVNLFFENSPRFLSINIDNGELNHTILEHFLKITPQKKSICKINASQPIPRIIKIAYKLRRKIYIIDFLFVALTFISKKMPYRL